MILQISFVAKLVCQFWDDNQEWLIGSLLFWSTIWGRCDRKHDGSVRIFPVELQDDAVVLQFSSALWTSKQKPFPRVSRESFKISVSGWLWKTKLLSHESNLPSNMYLKRFVFIWRRIFSVFFPWLSVFTTRSEVCKIIREKETNLFEACKLFKFCLFTSWLLLNHLGLSSYFT